MLTQVLTCAIDVPGKHPGVILQVDRASPSQGWALRVCMTRITTISLVKPATSPRSRSVRCRPPSRVRSVSSWWPPWGRSEAWPHDQVRWGDRHLAGRLHVGGHAPPAWGSARAQGFRARIQRGRGTAAPPRGTIHPSIRGCRWSSLFTQILTFSQWSLHTMYIGDLSTPWLLIWNFFNWPSTFLTEIFVNYYSRNKSTFPKFRAEPELVESYVLYLAFFCQDKTGVYTFKVYTTCVS